MSFSRYSLEKKQISLDRGISWEDVTPSETRLGELIGVTRTLIECEDMDCDLEQDVYYTDDGSLPTEICGGSLPYGIAKTIKFTYGAQCCNQWYGQSVTANSPYDGIGYSLNFGSASCYDSGYLTCWDYASNTVSGSQVNNACRSVCNFPEVCSCFRITSLMPWAEGKTVWKLMYKQHQIRAHCSDEWENDGEPEMIGIGERWYPTAGADEISWQHQIVTEFDASGNVTTWTDEGEPIIQRIGHDLPSGYTYTDGLTLDTSDYSELHFQAVTKDSIYVQVKGQIEQCGYFISHDKSHDPYLASNKNVCSSSWISDTCGTYGGYAPYPRNVSVSMACINPNNFKNISFTLIPAGTAALSGTVTLYSRRTTSIKNILLTRNGAIVRRLVPVMYGSTKKMFDSLTGTIYNLIQ